MLWIAIWPNKRMNTDLENAGEVGNGHGRGGAGQPAFLPRPEKQNREEWTNLMKVDHLSFDNNTDAAEVLP